MTSIDFSTASDQLAWRRNYGEEARRGLRLLRECGYSKGPLLLSGCGSGRLLLAFAELGAEVFGTEPDEELRLLAQIRNPTLRIFPALPDAGLTPAAIVLAFSPGQTQGTLALFLAELKKHFPDIAALVVEKPIEPTTEKLESDDFTLTRKNRTKHGMLVETFRSGMVSAIRAGEYIPEPELRQKLREAGFTHFGDAGNWMGYRPEATK